MNQKIWEHLITSSASLSWPEIQQVLAPVAIRSFKYQHEEASYVATVIKDQLAQQHKVALVVADPEMWLLVQHACHELSITCPQPLAHTSLGQFALITARLCTTAPTLADTWALRQCTAVYDATIWHTPVGQSISHILSEIPDTLDPTHYYHQLHQKLMTTYTSTYDTHPLLTLHAINSFPPADAGTVLLIGVHQASVPNEMLSYLTYWLASPRVLVTWAQQQWGSVYQPMTWLNHLRLLIQSQAPAEDIPAWMETASWLPADPIPQAFLPMPEPVRPAPCPPVSARPRQLPVTAIELWRRDPYAIYARYILNLRRQPRWDDASPRADFGIWLHDVLATCLGDGEFQSLCATQPQAAIEYMIRCGEGTLQKARNITLAKALWAPILPTLARWFVESYPQQAAHKNWCEITGQISLPAPAGDFTLTGQADRIDVIGEQARVIDYKTGALPTLKSIRQGWTSQLALEAWMVQAGGFAELPAPLAVTALQHWAMRGRLNEPASIREITEDVQLLIAEAVAGVQALISAYDDPAMPYIAQPNPDMAPAYNDYAHLEREAEWLV